MYGLPDDQPLVAAHDDLEGLAHIGRVLVGLPPDTAFVCIGTDRSTGDCYGPLVGSGLKALGIEPVYGTLDDPIHSSNLRRRVKDWAGHSCVLAVDSCLGAVENVGRLKLSLGPVRPGAGVMKDLPEVGDLSLTVVVMDADCFLSSLQLNTVSLCEVVEYAAITVKLIASSCGVETRGLLLGSRFCEVVMIPAATGKEV